jgi:Cys-tRNA(Pro)/Cys-tRNA(Cys) deacylase
MDDRVALRGVETVEVIGHEIDYTARLNGCTVFVDEPSRMKTNAACILDSRGIRYELRDYEVDPDDLSAETVAAKIGMPLEQVWKTLVARGDRNGVCLAVVPASAQLDLKSLARLTGDRKVDTVPLKDVQPLTGYVRGGVTALGCKKSYPVFVDETIELFDRVAISAGIRGTQILIAPADYLRATGATIGAIAG